MPSKKKKYNARFPPVSTEQHYFKTASESWFCGCVSQSGLIGSVSPGLELTLKSDVGLTFRAYVPNAVAGIKCSFFSFVVKNAGEICLSSGKFERGIQILIH